MSLAPARGLAVVAPLTRAGARLGLSGLILLGAMNSLQNAIAEGDTRTLSFHNLHTGENITVTYKRDGRYVDAALKKLDWFMRDWRRGRETHMNPRLFDALWQVYRDVGATRPIDVICGYRSPKTNAMLRARSGGVARLSQHILGKAIDFHIPGVPLAKVRAAGLKLQRGGVGFYPHSGSPFIHMDVGSVRHWPGISRTALLKIFPHGRTVHIPSDGRPLRGYAQALADIEARGSVPNARSLNAARAAGMISSKDVRVAELVSHNRYRKLIAMVNTGKGRDYGAPGAAPVSKAKPAPIVVASVKPQRPVVARADVPLPTARPKTVTLAALESRPAKAPVKTPDQAPIKAPAARVAAAENLFDARGIWTKAIDSGADSPPAWAARLAKASVDAATTGSVGDDVLAYAAERTATPASKPVRKAPPMGARLPRLISTAHASTASDDLPAEAAAMAQPLYAAPMAIGGQQWGSPWLRAAMLTPSVTDFLTLSRLNKPDPRWLRTLLHKPADTVLMSFAADPQYGMRSDRFSGPAVVFLATASFTRTQTASLQ